MQEEISLDDSSYDEIYERAMEKLRTQAPWWTHTGVSDPGIMLLEMWAILFDMQSYYIDQIQESHYRKYLKLLGISRDEGEAARTWIFFDHVKENRIVPEGTKFLSDRMVFETEEELQLTGNCLTGFYQADGINRMDTMRLFRKSSFVLQEGEEKLFSFTLCKPLNPGEEFCFFVFLDEKKERNAAGQGFFMAKLAWEYRTGNGWREAQVVLDESRGLLFSGAICLKTDTPMAAGEKGYEIRCRIKAGAYDAMPSLYKICLNMVRAVQKNTLCCEEEVVFTRDCHRAVLKSYLARTGRLRILRKSGEQAEEEEEGALWEDISASPEVIVEPPVTAERRERAVFFSGEGRVKIVCCAAGAAPEDFVRDVTGIAAQELLLPWQTLIRSSVKLMLKQETGQRTLYRACRQTEPEENRYGNAWHWKDGENTVVLGDGRHGEIPPAAKDGLCITSLVLCEGKKGNVSVGGITRWERPELFPGITCTNRLPGRGGREPLGPAGQFEEAGKAFSRQDRMVTAEDIGKLAKEVPGLLIQKAAADWKDGMLVVTISPKERLGSAYCIERYQALTREYLEQYRLAGTGLRIEIQNE